MTNQQQQNRRTILIIFAMTAIPFCIAWYLSKHPALMPIAKTSHGELVIPAVPTERTEFIGFDKFSRDNIKELSGHWLIVNVMPTADCKQSCQEAIYNSKQLHLMLNKDLTRVRRVVLLLADTPAQATLNWWPNDTRLLKIKASDSLITKIKRIHKGVIFDGMLFLIDPLGNIMMQYAPGFDPYKVEKDLKKLLNVSQIG
jgi:hypothetical protein